VVVSYFEKERLVGYEDVYEDGDSDDDEDVYEYDDSDDDDDVYEDDSGDSEDESGDSEDGEDDDGCFAFELRVGE
jgi:hypothetical protein